MNSDEGLSLNMAHMTKNDSELLLNAVDLPFWVTHYENGFIIPIDGDPNVLNDHIKILVKLGFSDAFCHVLKYAHRNNYKHVNYDRNALKIDGLQTFKW